MCARSVDSGTWMLSCGAEVLLVPRFGCLALPVGVLVVVFLICATCQEGLPARRAQCFCLNEA